MLCARRGHVVCDAVATEEGGEGQVAKEEGRGV